MNAIDHFLAGGLTKGAMGTGTLKMWNAEGAYGFIKDDAGGPDVFMHISALRSSGIDPENLRLGERLSFDVESTREGKTRAGNVRRAG
jgi:cold shock protein